MRRWVVVGISAALFLSGPAASAVPGHGGGGGGGGGGKALTFSITSAVGTSEDVDAGFLVHVTRSGSTVGRCTSTVTISTADGTATAPGDFVSLNTVVNFAKGQTSASVLVSLVNDTVPEDEESFTVNLSNPANACKGVGTAVFNGTTNVTLTDLDVVLTVPDGKHIALSGMSLAGCNLLAASLQIPNGNIGLGDNSADQCGTSPVSLSDTGWTNDTGQDAVVTLVLFDNYCLQSFSSDTTSIDSNGNPATVNHAYVVDGGTGSLTVDINDGAGCENIFNLPEAGAGNFHADVSIGDPPPPPFSGELTLHPGESVQFDIALSGCNTLEAVVIETTSGTSGSRLSNAGAECSDPVSTVANASNETGSDQTYILRLIDWSCTAIYNSDNVGGSGKHSTPAGSNPYTVDIADAGGCSEVGADNYPAVGAGNLSATVTVTAPA